MKCEKCHVNDATVKIVRIINNEKEEIYLCRDCAREGKALSFTNQDFSVSDFLSSFMGFHPQKQSYEKEATDSVCEKCKMTWSEFRKASRLGCDQCYETFREELMPMIRQVHGHTEHQGQVPLPERLQKQQKIKDLKGELQIAIVEEEYEKAAEVRDKIKALEEEK